MCGYPFKADEEYLVYATSRKDTEWLFTSICTRTGKLAKAADDLKELGEGTLPKQE